jgi:myo-inositol-1(or 4)-monophosphatase
MVECGWSHRRSNDAYYALIAAVMGQGCMMRAGGSGAMALADVACGRLDAYVELHINLWDVAAALVILREAGAKVSDFLSGDGATKGNGIVACAPGLAEPWCNLPGLPKLV